MEKRAVPLGAARGEYEVNRSRFIAAAGFAPSPEEALAFVEEERRRYPDASHHCWAYRMDEGIYRWSDDGEPGGTAGSPMLAMIARGRALPRGLRRDALLRRREARDRRPRAGLFHGRGERRDSEAAEPASHGRAREGRVRAAPIPCSAGAGHSPLERRERGSP